MANTVFKLRRSSVAGKVPNTSTLSIGELGLNLTDRKLYSSDGTNVWETGANLTTLTVSTNTNVNNVIFATTSGIYANGSFGLDTQVLKSNGSAIYWGTGGGGSGMTTVKQQYTGDGTTTVFPVTGGYDSNNLAVYVNGVMLRKGVEVDVISGTTFTIYSPPPNNAYIDVLGTATTIANGFSTIVSQQFTANGNSNNFVVPSGFIPTTVQVYLNGVKQIPAVDYTTSGGNTVNFFTTPPNNYIVDVYAYNTTVMQSAPVRQSNAADGTSTSYVISGGYIPAQLDVYMNGVKLNPSQANVASGYNVTFSSPPPAGAELSFVGFVPTNYVGVNTSASYVWSNTQTFANLYMTSTAGINANGSYGTSGQVLTSAGAATPTWSNQSSLSVGSAGSITGGNAGELLYQSAAGTTSKLAAGTASQVLIGGATSPAWSNISGLNVSSAVNLKLSANNTAGAIPYQTGADATTGLAIGTAGQVLTVNTGATAPQWVAQSTLSVGSATTATNVTAGMGDNLDNYMNFRVMRNSNTTTNNDGMYIGYGNTNSGATRLYGGGSTTSNVIINASGDITASGQITASSDIRLKENINQIDNALDKVLNLRGVEFDRIDIKTHQIGLIAQEVEEIIPEIVQENENGYKTVAYGNVVALLIEAIKDQQKQINALQEEIKTLKNN